MASLSQLLSRDRQCTMWSPVKDACRSRSQDILVSLKLTHALRLQLLKLKRNAAGRAKTKGNDTLSKYLQIAQYFLNTSGASFSFYIVLRPEPKAA